MDVVNFSEGILGIDQNAASVVAKCLRQLALIEEPEMYFIMNGVAQNLELGRRVNIEVVREIGERRLSEAQRLFLNS